MGIDRALIRFKSFVSLKWQSEVVRTMCVYVCVSVWGSSKNNQPLILSTHLRTEDNLKCFDKMSMCTAIILGCVYLHTLLFGTVDVKPPHPPFHPHLPSLIIHAEVTHSLV